MLYKKYEVNPKVNGPRAWFVNSARSIFPRATNTQILHARDFLNFLSTHVIFQMLIFKTFFSLALAL